MTLALNPRRLVQPAHEPLSLEEVKLFLRVEHAAEDTLLATLLQAAREAAEQMLNLSCITQTWQYLHTGDICDLVPLPYGPVISITQVERREREDDDWSVLDTANYQLRGNVLHLGIYPHAELRITYVAGLNTSAADVPANIRYALLQHVAILYESRGSAEIVNVSHLYAHLREVRV